MRLAHLCAIIGCLPVAALGSAQVLLDQELNGLDIRTWVVDADEASAALTPENRQRLRLTNNHSSSVKCSIEPEPAEDSWTFFPEATIRPGEEVELLIGGDYSTETIRVKLRCEDEDLL